MAGTTVAQISTHTHIPNGENCLSGCPGRTPGWGGPGCQFCQSCCGKGRVWGYISSACVSHSKQPVGKSHILGPNIVEPFLNSYVLEFFFKSLGDRKVPEAFWAGEWYDQIENTVLAAVRRKYFAGTGRRWGEIEEGSGEWGTETKQEINSWFLQWFMWGR